MQAKAPQTGPTKISRRLEASSVVVIVLNLPWLLAQSLKSSVNSKKMKIKKISKHSTLDIRVLGPQRQSQEIPMPSIRALPETEEAEQQEGSVGRQGGSPQLTKQGTGQPQSSRSLPYGEGSFGAVGFMW